MASVSRRRLAEAVVRLLREQPTRQSDIMRNVAAHLIEQKQIKQLDLLMKAVARELQRTEGVLQADVSSAFPLNETTRMALTEYLQQQTGAKTVELSEDVDSNLLSGVVVRTADKELDTTARHTLQQLASLNSGGKDYQ